MANVVRRILDQCNTGFPRHHKLWWSVGALVYTVSPLDILPDIVPVGGWLDDAMVIYLLVRIWRSPTLPWPPADGGGAASVVCPHPTRAPVGAKAVTP